MHIYRAYTSGIKLSINYKLHFQKSNCASVPCITFYSTGPPSFTQSEMYIIETGNYITEFLSTGLLYIVTV